MHRLLLMRHAKSSWSDESLDDHERPLDPRGERAAAVVGAYLEQSGVAIDRVLCSTALRARQTVAQLARLAPVPDPDFEQGLYLASAADLLERLRRLPESARTVLVIGHNPGMAELAENVAGRGPADELDQLLRKFPTAGLASLVLPGGSWTGLRAGAATLERFATPKRLV